MASFAVSFLAVAAVIAVECVAGLALVVILFDASLSMELRQIRRSLGPATRIALQSGFPWL